MPKNKSIYEEIAERQARALRQREDAQVNYMRGKYGHLFSHIYNMLEEISKEFAERQRNGEVINRQKIFKSQRFLELLTQINRRYVELGDDMTPYVTRLEKKFVAVGVEHAQGFIDEINDLYGLGVNFNRLPTQSIEVLAGQIVQGSPLRALIDEALEYREGFELGNKLLEGLAMGWNPRKIARGLRGNVSMPYQRLELLARDQVIRSHRMGSLLQYRESGIVTGYKRLAAKDRRTCLACLAMDGELFDVQETLPVHPQDRCSMVPIVKGGPNPTWESGEEWFKRQNKATQLEVMGPGRLQEWERGNFKFKQLATSHNNPTWGPSLRVTSLKDLKSGKGGVKVIGPGSKRPEFEGDNDHRRGPKLRQQLEELERGSFDKKQPLLRKKQDLEAENDSIRGRIERLNFLPAGDKRRSKIDDLIDRQFEIFEEIDELTKQINKLNPADRLRDLIVRGGKPNTKFDWGSGLKRAGKKSGPVKEAVEEGWEQFFHIVGEKKYLKGGPLEFFRHKSNGRAFHRAARAGKPSLINAPYGVPVRTIIHELGHHLEHRDKRAHQMAVDLILDRASQFPIAKLKDITGSPFYDDNEVAFNVGGTIHPYIWKIYRGWNYQEGRRFTPQEAIEAARNGNYDALGATEVISMGLEWVYHDPVKLAKNEPDLFDVIIDIIDLD